MSLVSKNGIREVIEKSDHTNCSDQDAEPEHVDMSVSNRFIDVRVTANATLTDEVPLKITAIGALNHSFAGGGV